MYFRVRWSELNTDSRSLLTHKQNQNRFLAYVTRLPLHLGTTAVLRLTVRVAGMHDGMALPVGTEPPSTPAMQPTHRHATALARSTSLFQPAKDLRTREVLLGDREMPSNHSELFCV